MTGPTTRLPVTGAPVSLLALVGAALATVGALVWRAAQRGAQRG